MEELPLSKKMTVFKEWPAHQTLVKTVSNYMQLLTIANQGHFQMEVPDVFVEDNH